MTLTTAPALPADFRHSARLAVAVAASILLLPFALNNVLQGRWLLGLWSTWIVLTLVFAAWSSRTQSRWASLGAWLVAPTVFAFLVLSIQRQGMIGVLWCYPTVLAFSVMFQERHALILNSLLVLAVGTVSLPVTGTELWPRFVVSLISVIVFASLFVRVIERQREVLEDMARMDPLTRLHNRSQLRTHIDLLADSSRSGMAPVSALMLDVNWFKRINDTHGHAVGDDVLCRVAATMRAQTRDGDRCFRVGGEEFLILLHDCDLAAARMRAEAVRSAIASQAILPGHAVTVSIGAAQLDADEAVSSWLQRADARLYEAKQHGRNRVAV
ncbi:MAG: diguanylate cyclase [Xanthomonadales bacterium]|nr:diguanylate cyclase [Xanthomonadales bacterium]